MGCSGADRFTGYQWRHGLAVATEARKHLRSATAADPATLNFRETHFYTAAGDANIGGECHLDANMVRSALPSLPLGEIDLLLGEKLGNLVSPSEFRIGEDARVMVSSVAEG